MSSCKISSKFLASVLALFMAFALATFLPAKAFAAQVTETVTSTMTLTAVDESTDNTGGDTDTDNNKGGDNDNGGDTDNGDDATDDGTDGTTTADDTTDDSDEGTVTATSISSDTAETSSMAKTGDAIMLLVAGLLVLALGAGYCVTKSRKLAGSANVRGAHASPTNIYGAEKSAKKKVVIAAVVTALVAATCLGGFASKADALAETIGQLINVNVTSSVTVDKTTGAVKTETITVQNNGGKTIEIDSATAPTELSDWTATFATKSVDDTKSATGTWSGKTIPADLLKRVQNEKTVTLTFTTTVTYDNKETVDETGTITTLDPSTSPNAVTKVTVKDADGNAVEGATVEIDDKGKVVVVLPEDANGKDVEVTVEDDSNNPKTDKEVVIKNNDKSIRKDAKTDEQGKVSAYSNIDKTDNDGKAEVKDQSGTVTNAEVTYNDPDDPDNSPKPVPGATVTVDDNGNVTVKLPDDSPANGKEIIVKTTDQEGNPTEREVTVKEKDYTLGPVKTDANTGEATFPGTSGTDDDSDGKTKVALLSRLLLPTTTQTTQRLTLLRFLARKSKLIPTATLP